MALPETLPNPERHSQGSWHCETCLETKGPASRAKMHCGFLPREQWSKGRGEVPKAFAGLPYPVDTCPGWVVRQPAVVEAAQAYAALEAGVLERFDPLGLRVVTQAALAAKRAFNLHEVERQRKNAARLRSG